eukprot:CAMPEP_0196795696 /NCGR_PEP_ID=MMETSP1104-20130614/36452_1 /TAXON_ID=33652 /ORGANISM="Cafeteria sp., Strain Caron Lab Isolate" /LENGTH=499 /DNA_ID=CAMNT_0042166091 /DNA_START=5 /DNA_END=1501 /DNA_ORIENTATION=+
MSFFSWLTSTSDVVEDETRSVESTETGFTEASWEDLLPVTERLSAAAVSARRELSSAAAVLSHRRTQVESALREIEALPDRVATEYAREVASLDAQVAQLKAALDLARDRALAQLERVRDEKLVALSKQREELGAFVSGLSVSCAEVGRLLALGDEEMLAENEGGSAARRVMDALSRSAGVATTPVCSASLLALPRERLSHASRALESLPWGATPPVVGISAQMDAEAPGKARVSITARQPVEVGSAAESATEAAVVAQAAEAAAGGGSLPATRVQEVQVEVHSLGDPLGLRPRVTKRFNVMVVAGATSEGASEGASVSAAAAGSASYAAPSATAEVFLTDLRRGYAYAVRARGRNVAGWGAWCERDVVQVPRVAAEAVGWWDAHLCAPQISLSADARVARKVRGSDVWHAVCANKVLARPGIFRWRVRLGGSVNNCVVLGIARCTAPCMRGEAGGSVGTGAGAGVEGEEAATGGGTVDERDAFEAQVGIEPGSGVTAE